MRSLRLQVNQSLEEIERYTRDASRKLLADRAMSKFKT